MANCIVTKLKEAPSVAGDFLDYLRIPIVSKGGSIYAQRYYLKYNSAVGKRAFIVGDGHFTNSSQADYGTYQAANSSREIASMMIDGDYDVYVSLTGLEYFLVNVVNSAIPTGVASGLDYVDYDRLFTFNPGISAYYMPSVDKWLQYVKYLKEDDNVQLILPDRSVDEIVQEIIDIRGHEFKCSFVIYPKLAWNYHSGKSAYSACTAMNVEIVSSAQYKIKDASSAVIYTATCSNGVWTYVDA